MKLTAQELALIEKTFKVEYADWLDETEQYEARLEALDITFFDRDNLPVAHKVYGFSPKEIRHDR